MGPTSNFKFPPLDFENYHSWRTDMRMYLLTKNLWKCIIPNSENQDFTNAEDGKALGLIYQHLSQTAKAQISPYQTAAEAWSSLERIFNRKTIGREILLKQKLYSIRMETNVSVDTHVTNLKSLAEQLSGIGSPIPEKDLVVVLLLSLPSTFSVLKTTIETLEPEQISFDFVVNRLIHYERDVNRTSPLLSQTALKLSKDAGVFCRYCKKHGHEISKCFKRKKRNAYKLASQKDQSAHAVTNESAASISNKEDIWYLDSGASCHMSFNGALFISKTVHREKATQADGNSLYSTHKGDILLNIQNQKVKLHNVLLIPNLSVNLISVTKLVNDGKKVTFNNSSALIECPNKIYKISLIPGTCIIENKPNISYIIFGQSFEDKIWHRRFGHPSKERLSKTIGRNIQSSDCAACVHGKHTRSPLPKYSLQKATHVLEIVNMDLWGKAPTPSYDGFNYFLLIVDEFTRKSFIYLLKTKTQSEILNCLQNFITFQERQTERKLKFLRSDPGSEFTGNMITEFLASKGIIQQFTSVALSKQNGKVEKRNSTILAIARTLLFQSRLSESFWSDAVRTSCYLMNKVFTRSINAIPDEVYYKHASNFKHLKVFGCLCYVKIPVKNTTKISNRSEDALFLGYSPDSKEYKVMRLADKAILYSRDVIFNEDSFISSNRDSTLSEASHLQHDLNTRLSLQEISSSNPSSSSTSTSNSIPLSSSTSTSNSPSTSVHTSTSISQVEQATQHDTLSQNELTESIESIQDTDLPTPAENVSDIHSPNVLPLPSLPLQSTDNLLPEEIVEDLSQELSSSTLRRSPRLLLKRISDEEQANHDAKRLRALLITHSSTTTFVPSSYKQAISCPDRKKWQAAMDSEMDSISAAGTWVLCKKLPERKAVSCKWVFSIKTTQSGEKRYKARLVARGFTQIKGVDYDEVFAPTLRPQTLRILLTIASHFDYEVEQFDFDTAFLNGVLTEEIYMTQPEGFVQDKSKYCLLKKSLYGLKQSPRCWYEKLSKTLVTKGFKQNPFDPTLYYSSEMQTYILVYVDDLIVCSKTKDNISNLEKFLRSLFKLKSLGSLSHFLNIQITRNRKTKEIFLSQENYTSELLSCVNLKNAKPVSTPMTPGVKLSKTNVSNSAKRIKQDFDFREVIGKLLYLSIHTRPDICYAVSQLSQFLDNPDQEHFEQLIYLLRYLQGTKHYCLKLGGKHLNLNSYCDSTWASDVSDRHSVGGYLIFIGDSLVSWSSKKQKSIALSSTEAEYMSLGACCQETLYIQYILKSVLTTPIPKVHSNLLRELPDPTIYCDNMGAIKLANNPITNSRSKHIEIKHHFVKELIKERRIQLIYCSTKEMPADLLTKSLPIQSFTKFRKILQIQPIPD